MKGFEDVTLSWKGEDFIVPANKQLMLIAEIEDALSGRDGTQAIQVLMRKDGPPYTRLAAAYGGALRYAGATVTDQEIYLSVMVGLASGDVKTAADIQGYILGLLAVIAPPISEMLNGGAPEKPNPTVEE